MRMKRAREAQGLKQSDLAEGVTALGVPMSQPAIGMIESGKSARISLDAAVAIAAVLDTPLERLYLDPLPYEDWVVARAEDPQVSESLAWLRTWAKARKQQQKESSGSHT